MSFRLSAESRKLLALAADDIIIGVVRESSKLVLLFRAGKHTSRAERVYPGHSQLLASGELPARGHYGFSFHLKNNKIRAFYRNSVLNIHKPMYSIRVDEMDGIIEALELDRADDFASYP